MSVKIFRSCIAVTATVSITLTACQKEIHSASQKNEQNISSLRSYPGEVNSSKQQRKILFTSNRDGNDEIYAMNVDGSNLVRLTFNNVPDGRATWSANGQHIAFASGPAGNREIY